MVYSSFNNNSYPLDSITETYEDKNISDIIYETEYNWNSLMRAIGIFELASVEAHGEVIYEAVDIKAFFRKIKEFFKGLLEKIGRLFKKIIEKVKSLFSKNKHKNIPKDKQPTNSPEKKSSSNDDKEEKKSSSNDDKEEKPVNYDHRPIEYKGYNFTTEILASEQESNLSISQYASGDLYDIMSCVYYNPTEKSIKFWANADEYLTGDVSFKNPYLEHICRMLTDNAGVLFGATNFNNVCFNLFRDKGIVRTISMQEKDINVYGEFIDNVPNRMNDFLNKQYKKIEASTNKTLSEWEKLLAVEQKSYDTLGEKVEDCKIKTINISMRWTKIIFEYFTILITEHTNAIIAQGNQYKAALKKILSGQPFDAKRYNSSAVFDAFMSNGDGTFVLS